MQKPMKALIVNADDFGKDEHKVEWTIKGFEKGALSSATIMAKMPASDRAVGFALSHPEFSFGLHLCLAEGKPVSDPSKIPSLIDCRTGRFWNMWQYVMRINTRLIKKTDLQTEIRAQWKWLADRGLQVTHLDGHGHVHRYPMVIEALAELKGEMPIKTVRCVQDIYLKKPSWGKRQILKSWQSRIERSFTTSTHFFMTSGQTTNRKWFTDFMHSLPDGVTEVGVHPGMDKPWRTIDTEDVFSYDFSKVRLVNFNNITDN